MKDAKPKPARADEFSAGELRDIQAQLRRRYVGLSDNIIDVGFGCALHESRTKSTVEKKSKALPGAKKGVKRSAKEQFLAQRKDAKRPFCAKFFVRRKWTSRPKHREDLIPRDVEVVVTRNRKKIRFTLPTDVVKFYTPRLTGGVLTVPNDDATAGIVIRWRLPGPPVVEEWGIITVRHLFEPFSLGAQASIDYFGYPFSGELIARSPKSQTIGGMTVKVDGAILLVDLADLKAAGIITSASASLTVLTLSEVIALYGRAGRSLRNPSTKIIEYRSYFPDTSNFPSLGQLTHIVEAYCPDVNCFDGGTSGSAWARGTSAAALQFGGTGGLNYQQGFGQVMEIVLLWAAKHLEGVRGIVAGSFSVVKMF